MMAKKRITAERPRRVVVDELANDIQALNIEAATTPQQLRANVRKLVKLLRTAREFGLIHVHHLLPSTAASERILAYLRMFVGEAVDGEELEIVSGISEYAGGSMTEFGAVVGDDDESAIGLFFCPPRQEFAQPGG